MQIRKINYNLTTTPIPTTNKNKTFKKGGYRQIGGAVAKHERKNMRQAIVSECLNGVAQLSSPSRLVARLKEITTFNKGSLLSLPA